MGPHVPTYGRATAQPPEPQQTDGAPNAYRAGADGPVEREIPVVTPVKAGFLAVFPRKSPEGMLHPKVFQDLASHV